MFNVDTKVEMGRQETLIHEKSKLDEKARLGPYSRLAAIIPRRTVMSWSGETNPHKKDGTSCRRPVVIVFDFTRHHPWDHRFEPTIRETIYPSVGYPMLEWNRCHESKRKAINQ